MVTSLRAADWDPSTPAPPELEPVRRLVNTLDLYRGRDQLQSTDAAVLALTPDLAQEAPREITPADLRRLRGARKAIRGLLAGQPEEVQLFDLRLEISGTSIAPVTEPASMDTYLARMVLELLIARRSGVLRRLKLCANPNCRWSFWDGSRPGTGKWCSMQVCGGQHKAREYRRRNRSSS